MKFKAYEVIEPKICVTMKCKLLILVVLGISVKAAPYIPMQQQMINQVINQQVLDQEMLNQIAQQSMEQWIMQNQYNSMRQQLMAMQQLQEQKTLQEPVPVLYNLPPQPILMLIPNTMTKTNHLLETPNNKDPANLKLGIGDADTVVINAENESNVPEMQIIPRGSVVVLPNGQRFIIGSIISAIPFLPFEVNVPDTISWIWNGISGIIGGMGQMLAFRPKPTTEAPVQLTQNTDSSTSSQEFINQGSIMPSQETEKPTNESRLKLIQQLITRKQNVGMPILMLPMAPTVPIQIPEQG